jgi:hypothetical protein
MDAVNPRKQKGPTIAGCDYHLSHPDIFVMQAAEEWDSCE